jgi:hypothetical protein
MHQAKWTLGNAFREEGIKHVRKEGGRKKVNYSSKGFDK